MLRRRMTNTNMQEKKNKIKKIVNAVRNVQFIAFFFFFLSVMCVMFILSAYVWVLSCVMTQNKTLFGDRSGSPNLEEQQHDWWKHYTPHQPWSVEKEIFLAFHWINKGRIKGEKHRAFTEEDSLWTLLREKTECHSDLFFSSCAQEKKRLDL